MKVNVNYNIKNSPPTFGAIGKLISTNMDGRVNSAVKILPEARTTDLLIKALTAVSLGTKSIFQKICSFRHLDNCRNLRQVSMDGSKIKMTEQDMTSGKIQFSVYEFEKNNSPNDVYVTAIEEAFVDHGTNPNIITRASGPSHYKSFDL